MACVDVGALAAPAPGVLRQVRRPKRVTPSILRLEQGELRAGMRPLTAGEDRIVFGQAFSRSLPGPLRRSPVSSVTWASSIQQARCPHLPFPDKPQNRQAAPSVSVLD